MKIEEVMLLQQVSRWNLVSMTRNQSVAEHSYNVAMLALDLVRRLNLDVSSEHRVVMAALHHDLNEVYTGDIPSPCKTLAYSQGIDLNQLVAEDECVSGAGNTVKLILKICDLMEAEYYAREFGVTTRARDAYVDIGNELTNIINASPEWMRGPVNQMREELSMPRPAICR